jgi:hypothetical protein
LVITCSILVSLKIHATYGEPLDKNLQTEILDIKMEEKLGWFKIGLIQTGKLKPKLQSSKKNA